MFISRQYAEAIANLPRENWEQLLEDLVGICESRVFIHAYKNPFINESTRLELITACLKKPTEQQCNFIQLLVRNKRIHLLADILSAYQQILRSKANIQQIQVITANKPTPKQKKCIEAFATAQLQPDIKASFEYKMDETIIGGFILHINDYKLDKSIATHLKNISYNIQGSSLCL